MSSIEETLRAESEAELIGAVRELREEIEVLRLAIDELREEIQTAVRNIFRQEEWRPSVASMPRDPCAEDFGERLNQVPVEQIDVLRHEATSSTCAAQSQNETGVNREPNDRAQRVSTATECETDDVPAPTRPSVDRSAKPITGQGSDRNAGKRQPLAIRIYFQSVMTDVVRAIGYETLARNEALLRLEPLAARYGQTAVAEAADELIACDEGSNNYWRLSSEARRLSRALLGPPPETETAAALSAGTPTDSPQLGDHTVKQPPTLEEVKAPRKEVLARLWEHLEAMDEDASDVPPDDLERFRERGWMLPDLMLADEFIAVRRKLSSAQRHDMRQWLEASEYGIQSTRVWPRETTDGWEWVYEVVAEDLAD